MDIRKVKKLIEMMEESDIGEIEIKESKVLSAQVQSLAQGREALGQMFRRAIMPSTKAR